MKTFKILAVLMMAIVGLSSCSGDEDITSNETKSKKITEILYVYGQDDKIQYLEKFGYNNSKLTSSFSEYLDRYISPDIENDLKITYSGNQIIMKGMLDRDETEMTYTINSNGYATLCKTKEYGGEKIREKNTTFEYSKDGYLIKAYTDEDSGNIQIVTFTYSNANAVKIVFEYYWEGNMGGVRTTNLTYSDKTNIGGIINQYFSDYLWEHTTAFYAGLLGKSTKSLVSYIERNHYPESERYIYTLDDEGYVITAKSPWNSYTYTYK